MSKQDKSVEQEPLASTKQNKRRRESSNEKTKKNEIRVMIIHCPSPSLYRTNLLTSKGRIHCQSRLVTRSAAVRISTTAIAAAVMMAAVSVASAELPPPPQDGETLSNVPQTLSGKDCKKQRIQRPKSKNAEKCTVKCVNTCIRSGDGEGPINIRRSFSLSLFVCFLLLPLSFFITDILSLLIERPLVVFKQGFRSRNYW